LVTNGSFVEIAYYENEEIMKPWRYDKHDLATFKSQQNGLKWPLVFIDELIYKLCKNENK